MNTDLTTQIVVQALSPLFQTMLTGGLEALGAEVLLDAPKRLYSMIRDRLQNNRGARQALVFFEKEPNNPRAQAFFEGQLGSIFAGDPSFASKIEEFVTESKLVYVIGGQAQITQAASQMYNIVNVQLQPGDREVIDAVLKMVGSGPGTVLDAMRRLDPIEFDARSGWSSDEAMRQFLAGIEQTFSRYRVDFQKNVSRVADVLRPAVNVEKSEEWPRPRRFLLTVFDEVGERLNAAKVFDGRLAETTRRGEFVGYHRWETTDSIAFPQLARAFDLDEAKMFFHRVKTYVGSKLQTAKVERRPPSSVREHLRLDDPGQFTYRVTYRGFELFQKGDYHVDFALVDKGPGYSSFGALKEKDYESYGITGEVLAKFLLGTIAFFFEYLSLPDESRAFMDSLEHMDGI